MRSRTGNSLSTLMFMVPLLGVPLMAVFGVPQFVPVIASSVSEESARPKTIRPKHDVGESASAMSFDNDSSERVAAQRGEPQVQDFFRPTQRPRRDSRPVREIEPSGREAKLVETSLNTETWLTQTSSEEPTSDASQRLNDLFGTTADTAKTAELPNRTRTMQARPRNEETAARAKNVRLVANSEQAGDGLTWREAVSRLNELGIQNFRLEPGRQAGEFYFACEFTPHRDARVTRRFEAEATEPLLAVRAVLSQIDDWLTRR